MSASEDDEPTSTPFARPGRSGLLLAAAPLAFAIGVFGMIFGAAASLEMDPALAVGMSLLVFSGTLQFATLGLLAGGAGVAAIVVTALALNARHVVLGAVLRPKLGGSALRRTVLAWFMLDESFGLALAAGRRAAFVLLVSGAIFFAAWVLGTVLGVLGARLIAVEGLAAALFPVLFVGLSAITVRGRGGVVRVAAAAALVLIVSLLVPEAHAFAPIVAALLVALPGERRS
ncbi:MAG TPA: AzlC family ABC transporter permease [Candidatus Limnocylindria bacterium]|nr:AzlC family ABC transporter permease [Candidatus Limnocylindria bacterium]